MNDYIIFTNKSYGYALEVNKIERIDQVPELTPVPNAHPFVDGMMMYQGQTLRVVNFRRMTDTDPQDDNATGQKLLIYRDENGTFGIKVDGIEDIAAFDETQIKSYAHEVKVGSFLQTRGVVEYKKKLVVIIDSIVLPQDEAV